MPSVDSVAEHAGQHSALDGLPYYGDASFTPHWYAEQDVPEAFHTIRAFSLLDQHGSPSPSKFSS